MSTTNINNAMLNASQNNHKELVEYFISKGANNFKRAIKYASLNNHKELVKFFISKGEVDPHYISK
jgi:ankyrin repeat protein